MGVRLATTCVTVRDMVDRTYRLGASRRLVNAVIAPLARLGLAGRHTYVLTVRGRNTGRPHSTPVTLVENGERWLVAPYGEVAWVHNARAEGEVEISRSRRSETMSIEEVTPQEAAPVLKQYVKSVPVVRPFFDVTPESPLDEFVIEAPRHPVFRLIARRSS
jgi:deazaflavin-dependent oxidoreductase (nitroreductase family)